MTQTSTFDPRSYAHGTLARHLLFLCASGATALSWAGCLFPPPYDFEPAVQNKPVMLVFSSISPDANTPYNDDPGTITLEVGTIYDEDPEPSLAYAWYSDTERNTFTTGSTSRIVRDAGNPEAPDVEGYFYEYAPITFEYTPCPLPDGTTYTTITLFVSDRSFQSTGNDGVEIAEGANVASHTWVFDFTNLNCNSN